MKMLQWNDNEIEVQCFVVDGTMLHNLINMKTFMKKEN